MKPVEYYRRRKELEMSQRELAVWLGVSKSTVERRESGVSRINHEAQLALERTRELQRVRAAQARA